MKTIYVLIIVVLLSSCNTTKKLQEVKEDLKSEVVADSEEKKNTDTKVVTDAVVDNKDEEFVYEPINENNPMVIDGVVYNNTKIKKVKKNTKSSSKEVSIKKDTQLIIKKAIAKTTKASAVKNLDKTSKISGYLWLWWLLIVVVVYIAYKIYR